MKKSNKAPVTRKRTTKMANTGSAVPQNPKEIMTHLLTQLRQQFAIGPATRDSEKKTQSAALCPALDRLTVGVDLGDKRSPYCILGWAGETLVEGELATTPESFLEFFQALTASRVVIEVGTHSAGVREVVVSCDHEVLVANPRLLDRTKRRKRKDDRIDAHKLARLGRVDPQSLYPIQHRSPEVRQDLLVLRARDSLVRIGTEFISTVRGLNQYRSRTGKEFRRTVPVLQPSQFSQQSGKFTSRHRTRGAPSFGPSDRGLKPIQCELRPQD